MSVNNIIGLLKDKDKKEVIQTLSSITDATSPKGIALTRLLSITRKI